VETAKLSVDITAKQLKYIKDKGEDSLTAAVLTGVAGRKVCAPYYIEYRYGYHLPNRPTVFRMRVKQLLELADQAKVFGFVPVMHITWSSGAQRFVFPESHFRKVFPGAIRRRLLSSRKIRKISTVALLDPSVRRLEDPTGERWVIIAPNELKEWTGLVLPPPDVKSR